MTPRKRGAQPGNTNALRHGFYSKSLRQSELTDLDQVSGEDFASEIAMLRAVTRRLLDLSNGATDLDQAMHLLSTLSACSHRLANMIYKRSLMRQQSQDSQFASILSQAINEVLEEKRSGSSP